MNQRDPLFFLSEASKAEVRHRMMVLIQVKLGKRLQGNASMCIAVENFWCPRPFAMVENYT